MSENLKYNYLMELEKKYSSHITETENSIIINGDVIEKVYLNNFECDCSRLFELLKTLDCRDINLFNEVILGYRNIIYSGINDKRTIIRGWSIENKNDEFIIRKLVIKKSGVEYIDDTSGILNALDKEFYTRDIYLNILFLAINIVNKDEFFVVKDIREINNKIIINCIKEKEIMEIKDGFDEAYVVNYNNQVIYISKIDIYERFKRSRVNKITENL